MMFRYLSFTSTKRGRKSGSEGSERLKKKLFRKKLLKNLVVRNKLLNFANAFQ